MEGENPVGRFAGGLVGHAFGPISCRFVRREDAFCVTENKKALCEMDGVVIPDFDARELDTERFWFGFQRIVMILIILALNSKNFMFFVILASNN